MSIIYIICVYKLRENVRRRRITENIEGKREKDTYDYSR